MARIILAFVIIQAAWATRLWLRSIIKEKEGSDIGSEYFNFMDVDDQDSQAKAKDQLLEISTDEIEKMDEKQLEQLQQKVDKFEKDDMAYTGTDNMKEEDKLSKIAKNS